MAKRSLSKIATYSPPAPVTSTELRVIGYASTPYQQRFGVPRQSGLVSHATAVLTISPEFQPELSLQGIVKCSHLWVIYLFHQNPSQKFFGKITPPRLAGEKLGIFATRSPNRPNPIGLSLVEIESVGPDHVVVRGVDFLNGTPILDIKPYLVDTESVPHARDWTAGIVHEKLTCTWSDLARQKLTDWYGAAHVDKKIAFEKLVDQTLALDPRPYGYKENFEKYKKQFFTKVAGHDIQFQYVHPQQICVLDIIPDVNARREEKKL